jgi:hypothetical protein
MPYETARAALLAAAERLLVTPDKRVDVAGELGVVLKQEPVRRVGVDLHSRLRDQAGEHVGKCGRIIRSPSPLVTNRGMSIALTRCSWLSSGMPQSQTASY